MAATKDLSLLFEVGDFASRPLAASAVVFRHTAIGQVSGANTFRALVAGDKFAGIALDGADNTGGAAGAVTVHTRITGRVLLTVAGADATTAVGTAVYASADDTYTLTSTSNSPMGKIAAYSTPHAKHVVEFNAALN